MRYEHNQRIGQRACGGRAARVQLYVICFWKVFTNEFHNSSQKPLPWNQHTHPLTPELLLAFEFHLCRNVTLSKHYFDPEYPGHTAKIVTLQKLLTAAFVREKSQERLTESCSVS